MACQFAAISFKKTKLLHPVMKKSLKRNPNTMAKMKTYQFHWGIKRIFLIGWRFKEKDVEETFEGPLEVGEVDEFVAIDDRKNPEKIELGQMLLKSSVSLFIRSFIIVASIKKLLHKSKVVSVNCMMHHGIPILVSCNKPNNL